jgi:hypothetical protein
MIKNIKKLAKNGKILRNEFWSESVKWKTIGNRKLYDVTDLKIYTGNSFLRQ